MPAARSQSRSRYRGLSRPKFGTVYDKFGRQMMDLTESHGHTLSEDSAVTRDEAADLTTPALF